MIYVVKINNKEYEVEVERGNANIIKTTDVTASGPIPAAPIAAQNPSPAGNTASSPSAHSISSSISAPMPGTILDIKVSAGKPVVKGEVVVILETMKMENEVTAPADGVISQILVTKGASVATGDALISMQ